jgi:hypothetical protein
MKAKTRIHFNMDDDKRTADGKCPVKLCVTFSNQRRYYSIDANLKNPEWNYIDPDDIPKVATPVLVRKLKNGDVMGWRIMTDGTRGKFRDMAFEYDRIKRVADDIIESIPNHEKTHC